MRWIIAALLTVSAILPARAAEAPAEPIGECRFDRDTLTFAGSPVEQATCLLRKVGRGGTRSAQPLPAILARLLEEGGAPSPEAGQDALALFPEPYAAWAREKASDPVARTEGGFPLGYFVIHDTSMPFLGHEAFPRDLDHDARVNDLWTYVRDEPVAHLFVSRAGQVWPGHDLAEGWRATKLESWVVGKAARGRMVHVELVQPRRFAPGSDSLGDTLAPEPGFSAAQYRLLAASYVHASARAGRWLIPAFHATVDAGIPDGHDDPQNFELERFARELERLVNRRKGR